MQRPALRAAVDTERFGSEQVARLKGL